MATIRSRCRRYEILAMLALTVAACHGSDDVAGTYAPRHSDRTLTTGVFVSAAVLSSQTNSTASATESWTHVSLRPGTVPTGIIATITNVRTSVRTQAPIANGGFDPVPIPAALGDTVHIEVAQQSGTTLEAFVIVRPQPPVIVRTNPPEGQTDVPINTSIRVILSEPIDPASITPSSLTLRAGATPILGTVRVAVDAPYAVEFVPDGPLTSATTFTLSIASSISGISGLTLPAAASAAFTTANPVASVTINGAVSSILSLTVGQTVPFTAILRDAANNVVTAPISWSSSDVTVATVSADGLATAVKPGTAIITATSQGKSGSTIVQVGGPNETGAFLVISPFSTILDIDQTVTLTPILRDNTTGATLSGHAVTWRSSDPSIASVSDAGVVTAHAVGSATINAITDVATASATIVVESLSSPIGPFAAVTAGFDHTCAITTTGAAYCWGIGDHGQLGDGRSANSSVPVRVSGAVVFTAISAGLSFTCGLSAGGLAYCWGAGYGSGALGNLPFESCGQHHIACSSTPRAVAGNRVFKSISAGGSTACGITLAGSAYCWGWGEEGELGDGTGSLWHWSDVPVAVLGALNFASISAGSGVTCGVTTSGAGYCWGANQVGGLGTGSSSGPEQCYFSEFRWPFFTGMGGCSRAPVAVVGAGPLSSVSVNDDGACALRVDGGVMCWGVNRGQLGNGSLSGPETCSLYEVDCSTRPVAVAGSLPYASLGPSRSAVCALTAAGAAYCWGNNFAGGIGNGDTTTALTPTAVSGGLTFSMVDAGRASHTCGLTTDGVIYCWGDNGYGQLGTGSRQSSLVPIKVARQR